MKYSTDDIVKMNGLTACEVCGFFYVPTFEDDILQHAKFCSNFVKAVRFLGYKPNFRKEREELKSMAYDLLSKRDGEDLGIEDFITGAETLLEQYFDRSLAAAISNGYYKKHPTFDEFIAMKIQNIHRVPEFVREEMIRRYGVIEGEIPPGHTYWYPKYSKYRKLQFESWREQRLRTT